MPQYWMTYEGVDIDRYPNGAYIYRSSRTALDANGSPRAYHPQDIGIDTLANAGYPHHDWRAVLATDPDDRDRPYVQPGGPFAGYFVSKTALYDDSLPEADSAAYVDSERVPYIVFPGAFRALGGTGGYGDLAMVRALGTGRETAAIVADGGPLKAPLGEMSLALATALGGIGPDPRNGRGKPWGTFEYIVFAGSAATPAWPRSFEAISAHAHELLAAVGGWPPEQVPASQPRRRLAGR